MKKGIFVSLVVLLLLALVGVVAFVSFSGGKALVYTGMSSATNEDVKLTVEDNRYILEMVNMRSGDIRKIDMQYSESGATKIVKLTLEGGGVPSSIQELRVTGNSLQTIQSTMVDCRKQGNTYIMTQNGFEERFEIVNGGLDYVGSNVRFKRVRDNYYEADTGYGVATIEIMDNGKAMVGSSGTVDNADYTIAHEEGRKLQMVCENEVIVNIVISDKNARVEAIGETYTLTLAK